MSDDTADALFGNALAMVQGAAAMGQLAALLGSFRNVLLAKGFTGNDALELCKVWLEAFLTQMYEQRARTQTGQE